MPDARCPMPDARFDPVIVGANATVNLGRATMLDGFLCKTGGTLTVTTAAGLAILSAFPVTAGQYVSLPFNLGGKNAVVVAAGGASGTLAVW